MIDLYYWSTPNGDKILILLEELELVYTLRPINILQGEQYSPEFLQIAPNNKIPAIRIGQETLFESGAILLHLAETNKALIPEGKRTATLQWLFWQIGGLGPMAGQAHHFNVYASEKIPYAVKRYQQEVRRLYKVLEQQLDGKEYIVDQFSIADIACYPWIECYNLQGVSIDNYPNIQRWLKNIRQRPSVKKIKSIHQQLGQQQFSEEHRRHLFRESI